MLDDGISCPLCGGDRGTGTDPVCADCIAKAACYGCGVKHVDGHDLMLHNGVWRCKPCWDRGATVEQRAS